MNSIEQEKEQAFPLITRINEYLIRKEFSILRAKIWKYDRENIGRIKYIISSTLFEPRKENETEKRT